MRSTFLFLTLTVPLSAQFLTPNWRNSPESEHAHWDRFTSAHSAPNAPDVASDSPTNDAKITGITSSAFLTSSGNIYSFQSATSFQLADSTNFPIRTVFLQLATAGSEIDSSSVRLFTTSGSGESQIILPTSALVLNQDTLDGEFGGLGTTHAFQWDLSDSPVSGNYRIIFSAAESSMSLDQVSLDTSSNFEEVRPKVPAPRISLSPEEITLTWNGSFILQSSPDLSSWTDVSREPVLTDEERKVALPLASEPVFFRLRQASAMEHHNMTKVR